MSIRTLGELFLVTADFGKEDHLLHKVDGEYRPISTEEFADRVRKVAKGLQDMGIQPGDRVALMADNGPHWPIVDFGVLSSGAATVPIYPTLRPDQAAYILQDSGARVLFVETPEQLEGLLAKRDELPELELLVLISGEPASDGAVSLEEFYRRGEGYEVEALERVIRAIEPDALASLVYTSGTTGQPKGVILTHDNFVSNILTSIDLLSIERDFTAISFLPLSHVFERMIDYCYFYKGCSIGYAESVQTVAQNFQEIKPHMFVSVPRVYEKVLAKVYENVANSPPLRQKIFAWAEKVGREALPYRLKHEHPPGLLGLKLAIADGLVFGKIRERLGGRFEFAFSGGAPLGKDTAEFFWAAGVCIYEGYGLTETSPVISANYPGHTKLGTVGRPISGVEVEIAEDGEILVRGPNVMKGYFNNPEATTEVLEEDGTFHTGDIGELDEDGYLSITDRKKEIIVNAYGKNIAPAPIENSLKASRFVSQAVIIGDRRKFLSCLIVPDLETLKPWARGEGLDPSDVETLLDREEVEALYREEIERVNAQNASYEQIQAFELLAEEFTLEGGELTPTQKIKRRIIHDKYGDIIDRMYASAAQRHGQGGSDT